MPFLQVPEEEREYETDAHTHDPGDEHKSEHPQVRHGLEYPQVLRVWLQLKCEHLGLGGHRLSEALRLSRAIGGLLLLPHVGHRNVVGRRRRRVPEGDLRGNEQGQEHEECKDVEADMVVLLAAIDVALGLGLVKVGVVEYHTHEEHGDGPTNWAEHSLASVFVLSRDSDVGHTLNQGLVMWF